MKKWLPAIVVMGIVFWLSSRQGVPLAPTFEANFIANKFAHLFWFALLCLCFYRATKSVSGSVALTTAYGAFDELHQYFTPTRTASPRDLLIDLFAACLVGFILWKFYPNLPKKLKIWLQA